MLIGLGLWCLMPLSTIFQLCRLVNGHRLFNRIYSYKQDIDDHYYLKYLIIRNAESFFVRNEVLFRKACIYFYKFDNTYLSTDRS